MEESKHMGSAVLYGIGSIFIIAIASSLVFSLLLKFTSMDESSIKLPAEILAFISLFAGGFISGGKGKQKGWLLGGLTGAIYTLVIFLFQYLGHDSLFSAEQTIYHTCFLLVCMMGGILGVNMSSKSRAA
ncbi:MULTISPECIES: TIGR04086 family membrane protein [Bacillaceae]|uniref:Membrane protein n=2 Tax=Bacillus infantis TaxID=324767 RepID=U5LCQ2_9BACI|nr:MULTISPECIES: TIGR04086 family membrane protein [Bacillus]OXT18985.1 hypothetical protein B9K06_01095 [Bacillus sp. OG2]AGX05654.1 membrane protein [Bacillus infantis NRRL B-14911]EAR63635.1 hypothetical protein B14911_01545 [Bacillus sp. NRRL B-14911]MCA1036366.1 TIGR04086 family membrane protein [Bacillus infantis]MCP1159921.1 TIGR04086 family membrane protein [Bacillus infantis]